MGAVNISIHFVLKFLWVHTIIVIQRRYSMYKACIFDLDGTLTDTLESLTYSVNKTLEELGQPNITSEQCESFVGNGAKVLIEKSLRAVGDEKLELLDKAMEAYGRIFGANCTYQVEPYRGVRELLEGLTKKGVKLAVLSNKPHAQTVHVVKEIFGSDLFAYTQGQCEEIPRKPNPAGIYHIAQKLQIKPEECVYIGDSEVDIKTGLAAKVKTIGVTWGFRSKEILKDAGATNTVDNPQNILDVISEEENI